MTELQLISVNEAISTLHITRATLWRMRKDGRLHAVKLGKRVMFRSSDISNLISNSIEQ